MQETGFAYFHILCRKMDLDHRCTKEGESQMSDFYPYLKGFCSTFFQACYFVDLSFRLFFSACELPFKRILKKFCSVLYSVNCFFVVFDLYPQILLISFNLSGLLAHMLFPTHTNIVIYIYTQSGLVTHKKCHVTLIFALVSLLFLSSILLDMTI